MTYWLLVLSFVNHTDLAVLSTYEECSYAAAIITNDYAYMPVNTLKFATCLPINI